MAKPPAKFIAAVRAFDKAVSNGSSVQHLDIVE